MTVNQISNKMFVDARCLLHSESPVELTCSNEIEDHAMQEQLCNFKHVIYKRSDEHTMHIYPLKRVIFSSERSCDNNKTSTLCTKTKNSMTADKHHDNYNTNQNDNAQITIHATEHRQLVSTPKYERAGNGKEEEVVTCNKGDNSYSSVTSRNEDDDEMDALEFFSE